MNDTTRFELQRAQKNKNCFKPFLDCFHTIMGMLYLRY